MGEDRSLAFFSKSCFKNTIFNFFFLFKKETKLNCVNIYIYIYIYILNTTEF